MLEPPRHLVLNFITGSASAKILPVLEKRFFGQIFEKNLLFFLVCGDDDFGRQILTDFERICMGEIILNVTSPGGGTNGIFSLIAPPITSETGWSLFFLKALPISYKMIPH